MDNPIYSNILLQTIILFFKITPHCGICNNKINFFTNFPLSFPQIVRICNQYFIKYWTYIFHEVYK